MLSDFLTDFNTAKSQSNLIPKGTTVKVKMAIKPGGYENWFTKSYTTGSIYLNAEFTVTEGPYAKRKIFQVIGIKSGKARVEGEDTWGESGRSMLRSILESARNIHANDTSEKAVIARKINSIADFNGLEFTAKVGIEADSRYGDRNRIATVVTPEQNNGIESDWLPFMKYDEGKLWAAVITRALQDAAGRNLKLKKEACKCIRSRSFETVCELANLDSKRLKNMLIKKEGNFMGFSSQKEIKSLLIDNIKECVSYLLPGGEFYQDRFYLANLGKDKIIVEIKGEKAGNWNDIYKEKKGDILSLWTLVEGNIDSAKKWLNAKKNSTLQNNGEKAFSVRHYLNDKSPMPKDIIGPRILTPGGLLVIGGTPKIGKSNFLLSMLVHLAAGVSFLGMKPAKPLKIFYLQNEMEYDYIRERLQKLRISKKTLDAGTENLVITQKIKLTLNVEEIEEIMSENLDLKTVDLIVG